MSDIVVVRGAGDLATGTIIKLHNAGFKVIALEVSKPTTIRRFVAFSEVVFKGETVIEGVRAKLIKDISEAKDFKGVCVIVDEKAEAIEKIKPIAVVDAIIAKKNLGTRIDMAEIVIALGPGFEAKVDCHAVVETMRGHNLGRIYYEGQAIANTGVPGEIGGVGKERVIHAPNSGVLVIKKDITSIVDKGDIIATIDGVEVEATISGVIRGIIMDGMYVRKGMKIADIDPRVNEVENCFSVSDKARCIAGGVLEAILYLKKGLS